METENEVLELNYEGTVEVKKSENVMMGVVGAMVGAILGGASIILISQLGYVAAISGLILAFCTIKGYQLLAGGMSTKGLIICSVLMLITPFVADWIDWGILILQTFPEYDLTIIDTVLAFPEFLKEDPELLGDYLMNLGKLYLFVILGGFVTLKNAFKGK